MKLTKYFLVAICAIAMALTACSRRNQSATNTEQQSRKAIVCYFSATGTTEAAAKRIAQITGADIHEIVPETPYTAEDLDWNDSLSRSSVEMRDRTLRPALKDSITDLSAYDVVFIGYPNWWNTNPSIINTFIEANNLKGKLVVPFMTSGGDDITNSEEDLKQQYPDLTFGKGMLLNDKTDSEIKDWIEQFK